MTYEKIVRLENEAWHDGRQVVVKMDSVRREFDTERAAPAPVAGEAPKVREPLTDEQLAILHAEPRNERERIMQITLRNRDVCGYNCDCHDEIFSDAEVAKADALFAPPTPVAGEAGTLVNRITAYLSLGGMFNPEAMEHDKVRDLLIDCGAAL